MFDNAKQAIRNKIWQYVQKHFKIEILNTNDAAIKKHLSDTKEVENALLAAEWRKFHDRPVFCMIGNDLVIGIYKPETPPPAINCWSGESIGEQLSSCGQIEDIFTGKTFKIHHGFNKLLMFDPFIMLEFLDMSLAMKKYAMIGNCMIVDPHAGFHYPKEQRFVMPNKEENWRSRVSTFVLACMAIYNNTLQTFIEKALKDKLSYNDDVFYERSKDHLNKTLYEIYEKLYPKPRKNAIVNTPGKLLDVCFNDLKASHLDKFLIGADIDLKTERKIINAAEVCALQNAILQTCFEFLVIRISRYSHILGLSLPEGD